jgi:hypothetical protein
MKAIIDSTTGELLFTTQIEVDIVEGTIVLEDEPTGNYWDFENQVWYTVNDINQLTEIALDIDLQYTGMISELLRKHIEKLSIDGISIPQDVIDERDRLRAECNQKIMDLGITNFAYRQSNLRL